MQKTRNVFHNRTDYRHNTKFTINTRYKIFGYSVSVSKRIPKSCLTFENNS